MEKFAQRLKQCREQKKSSNPNWTQKYVADKIGMARTTYTAYENGTKLPPLDIVDSLASLLEVSTDYLLGRTDIKDPNNIDTNAEFEAWVNDPRSKILFKEFNESSEEQKEALLKMWEILKNQGKL
ncbi:helix-turn-helix transcriptional regulator [Psychrobacillus sp. FSL K6-2843]|uniref:helix-turn-helix domain-containing protein n=1 Tax=Psychrobacillus sp. FSL K6-2843 TaxID=2921549 RepID=UPI00315AE57F